MTESELVRELRTQNAEYKLQIQQLEERCRRAEYSVQCSSILNLRLFDWLKERGIKVPKNIRTVTDLDLPQSSPQPPRTAP